MANVIPRNRIFACDKIDAVPIGGLSVVQFDPGTWTHEGVHCGGLSSGGSQFISWHE